MQCISGACSNVNEPIVLIEPIGKPINIKWKSTWILQKYILAPFWIGFHIKKILHSGKYCHDLGSLFLLNKKFYNKPWPLIFYVWLKVLLFALHWSDFTDFYNKPAFFFMHSVHHSTLDLLAPDPFKIMLSKGSSLWKLCNFGY